MRNGRMSTQTTGNRWSIIHPFAVKQQSEDARERMPPTKAQGPRSSRRPRRRPTCGTHSAAPKRPCSERAISAAIQKKYSVASGQGEEPAKSGRLGDVGREPWGRGCASQVGLARAQHARTPSRLPEGNAKLQLLVSSTWLGQHEKSWSRRERSCCAGPSACRPAG